MFGGKSVKLEKPLYVKVKRCADLAGYSSVEEFVAHVLEKEIARLDQAGSGDDFRKQLSGLGYLS